MCALAQKRLEDHCAVLKAYKNEEATRTNVIFLAKQDTLLLNSRSFKIYLGLETRNWASLVICLCQNTWIEVSGFEGVQKLN